MVGSSESWPKKCVFWQPNFNSRRYFMTGNGWVNCFLLGASVTKITFWVLQNFDLGSWCSRQNNQWPIILLRMLYLWNYGVFHWIWMGNAVFGMLVLLIYWESTLIGKIHDLGYFFVKLWNGHKAYSNYCASNHQQSNCKINIGMNKMLHIIFPVLNSVEHLDMELVDWKKSNS